MSLFEKLQPKGDPEKELAEASKSKGRALVVVAYSDPYALVWSAGEYLRDTIIEAGGHTDGFALKNASFDHAMVEDGLFIAELSMVDDGPGDWPGTREFLLSVTSFRTATAEEWAHHCDGDWPWDNEEGWSSWAGAR